MVRNIVVIAWGVVAINGKGENLIACAIVGGGSRWLDIARRKLGVGSDLVRFIRLDKSASGLQKKKSKTRKTYSFDRCSFYCLFWHGDIAVLPC